MRRWLCLAVALAGCSNQPRAEEPVPSATDGSAGSAVPAVGSQGSQASPPAGSAAGSARGSDAVASAATGSDSASGAPSGTASPSSPSSPSSGEPGEAGARGSASSGGDVEPGDDRGDAPDVRAVPAADDHAPAGSAAQPATRTTGELQARVEWPNVPPAARRSPGRTPCNTPRAPSVAPTTTWGVPGALVVVDGAPPPPTRPTARITLADCALTPRLVVGATLAITSAVDRPAKLLLRKRGTVERLFDSDPIPVQLPIAGHTVTVTLDAGAIYSLETDAPTPELAYIAAVPNGWVSDATGHIHARGLAAGPHAATAWLPPRAGQPARLARGTATVEAGKLAELTLKLTP